jgi:hypothetical protein
MEVDIALLGPSSSYVLWSSPYTSAFKASLIANTSVFLQNKIAKLLAAKEQERASNDITEDVEEDPDLALDQYFGASETTSSGFRRFNLCWIKMMIFGEDWSSIYCWGYTSVIY